MTTRRNQRRLEVRLASDAKQFDRGFDQAKRSTQSFDQQMNTASRTGVGRFNSSMDVANQRLRGFVGIAAGALAGGALVRWAGQVRESANALTESVNAVQVVFGEASQTVLDFGENAAESVGLANSEFNQLVVPIGSMLRNFGFDADDAADATLNLAERAADMASVFNVDVPEALGAIQAALRGESDPIERFGASISAARVETFLLEEGLVESTAAITDADKVMGRYRLILEDTERVAGDFANTAGSDANATRIFQARLEDLRAEAGQAIIPIFEGMTGAGNDLIPVLANLAEDVLPVLAEGFGNFLAGVGAIVEAIGDLPDGVKIASGALLGLLGTAKLLYAHPVIAGLGLVTTGIALIGDQAREEQEAVDGLRGALEELAKTGDRAPVEIEVERQIIQEIADSLEGVSGLQEGLRLLGEEGIRLPNLVEAIMGDEAALQRFQETVDSLRVAPEGVFADPAIEEEQRAISTVEGLVQQMTNRYAEANDEIADARANQDELNDLLGEFGDASRGADRVLLQNLDRYRDMADGTAEAEQRQAAFQERLEAVKAETEELDGAIGDLADSYAQDLNKAAQGFLDIFEQAPEIDLTQIVRTDSEGNEQVIAEGIDAMLQNAETRVERVERFFAGLQRLSDEGLGALAEEFAKRGPEAVGDLEAVVEDLDAGGEKALQLNDTVEKGREQIGTLSAEMGLALAEQKIPMLQEFQNLGVDLGEALAQGLDSVEITLGIDARASGVRRDATGLGRGSGRGAESVPVLHGGGVFRAPTPGGEGFALLRDREVVSTPQQFVSDTLRQGTASSGGGTTSIVVNESKTPQLTAREIDRMLDERRRQTV